VSGKSSFEKRAFGRRGWLRLVAGIGLLAGSVAIADPSLSDQIDPLFHQWDTDHTPGCAVGVYRDGKIAYARGYGLAEISTRRPITPETVFELASSSKQFTATAIALLAEDGRVHFDDSIRRSLPALPEVYEPVTLADLMHHTSGLRDYLSLAPLVGFSGYFSDAQAVGMIAQQQATNFPAETNYQYSNSNFFLLSQVVRAVTGQTLSAFARGAIFAPLGMDHSEFRDDYGHSIDGMAFGYTPADDGYALYDTTLTMTGDGGVYTSIDDFFRWDENFYHNVLGRGGAALIDELTRPAILKDGRAIEYALGLRVSSYRGLSTVEHSGAFNGYRSILMRFPEHHFSAALLCNTTEADTNTLAHQIADRLLAPFLSDPPAPVFVSVPDSALQAVTGDYRSDDWLWATNRWRVTLSTDGLSLDIGDGATYPLGALSERRFLVKSSPDMSLEFSDCQPGGGCHLHAVLAGDAEARFDRLATAETPLSCDRACGIYHGAEIGQDIEIGRTGDDWTLSLAGYQTKLTTTADAALVGKLSGLGPFEIRWQPDGSLRLSTDDLRGLRFDLIGGRR
jgi:CubicO group peptidase (beta-lactamase class C family)